MNDVVQLSIYLILDREIAVKLSLNGSFGFFYLRNDSIELTLVVL